MFPESFQHNCVPRQIPFRRRSRIRLRPTADLSISFLFIGSILYLLILCATHLKQSFPKAPKDDWSLEDYSTEDSIGDIYHSQEYFSLDYAAMQTDFEVFVYPGGNATACYDPKDKLKSKCASEHYFFKNLMDSLFLTDDPHKAHLFFIPISCQKRGDGEMAIKNYVKTLISKYPYLNRTLGADHFFVSCLDVGSRAIEEVPFLMKNAIRLVCSPS